VQSLDFVKKAFDPALQPKLQLHLNIIAAICHMFKVCGDMRCVLRAFWLFRSVLSKVIPNERLPTGELATWDPQSFLD